MENYIFGIRPVMEMLEEGIIPERIFIQKGLTGSNFHQLFQRIRQMEVPFQMVPVEKLNRITRNNHQGVIAQSAVISYRKLEHILPIIYAKDEIPLIVILENVTDVRNLGAIARSAEVAGAHAIVIGEKSSAPVNADAIKTSAGALTRIPVCKEKDILETIAFLNESGVKTVGCTEKTGNPVYLEDLTGPVALIMGSEDKGLSKSTLVTVQSLAAIPQKGKTGSLNVSVATGVVLFEILRQREFKSDV